MSEQFLLEDDSGDTLFLEDNSGSYRQDFPIKVVNQTIEITETRLPEQNVYLLEDDTGAYYLESGDGYYRQDEPFYHSAETIGINETHNYVRILSKTFSDTIGLTEVKNRLRNQVRNISTTLGITETKRRLRSMIKNIVHFDFDNYSVEDSSGNLELESGLGNYTPDKTNVSEVIGLISSIIKKLVLTRNINETVGLDESTNKLREQVRNVNEIVGIDESANRDRTFFKNTTTDIIGLSDIQNIPDSSQFEFTLEDGSGTLYLEDGSGNYIQEAPVKVFNETIGVTENRNRLMNVFKNISSTIGLSEVNEAYNVIKKVVSTMTVGITENKLKEITTLNLLLEGTNAEHYQLEDGTGGYHLEVPVYVFNNTLGLTETKVSINTILKNINETINLTVLSNYATGFFKVATSFIVSVESAINKIVTDVNVLALEDGSGNYLNEDGLGFYQLDQLLIVRIQNTIMNITESSQKLYGGLKNITDQVNVVESIHRLRDMVRNFSQTVGITEFSNRLGLLFKNFSQSIGITESSERYGSLFRWISSTIGLTESSNRITGFSKIFNDIIQLSDSKNIISGIVKYISDTVGLVGTAIQFRLIAFTVNTGDFITLSLIDLSNFITSTQQDTGDMTGFTSFDAGDMKVDNG